MSVVTGQRGSRQMLQSPMAEEEEEDDDDDNEEEEEEEEELENCCAGDSVESGRLRFLLR